MPQTTADNLQNLCYAARQSLKEMSASQISLIAAAIFNAEADITEMRKPIPNPAPLKDSTPDATPAPTGEAAP